MEALISRLLKMLGLRTSVAKITASAQRTIRELHDHATAEQVRADRLAEEHARLLADHEAAIKERTDALNIAKNLKTIFNV